MGGFFSSYDGSLHVVVVGAGYAGVAAAKALDPNVRVTLIEATDSHNHKISSLRAAVVPGWERRIRLPLDGVLKNGKVIQSEVTSVDTGRVTLSDDNIIECDYIILAHGKGKLNFPCDYSDDVTDTASYETKARKQQKLIANAESILLVGGGAVGVELAGEIAAEYPSKKITLVHSRNTLLSNLAIPLNPAATSDMQRKLQESGVNVIMNARVTNTPLLSTGDGFVHTLQPIMYTLSTEGTVSADLYIDCTGTTRRVGNLVPHVDEHNFVKVKSDLQVENMPKVFCIGDANNVNETKLAFFAQHHARVAVQNIYNLHHQKPTTAYSTLTYALMAVPIGPYKGAGAIGSTLLGDFFVSLVLGRGLFVHKVWGGFGLTVPELVVRDEHDEVEL